MVLENINTFTNLSIKKGSTLTLRVKAVDRLKIFLITFSGKTITLLLKPTCTITELKTMIEFMEDIPCEEQALIFKETVLGDNGTLFDYRINKNETLKLMRQSTGIMEIDILIFYNGETITLKVKPSDTIYSIKAMIQDETQKPIDEQDLIFNRTVLHNDDTLAGCDIHKESTLTLLWSARVYIMKIFIKTATEKTVTLHVKPSDTIYNLKLKIQDKEGVPPCKQTLIFNKNFLEDSATIADYRIRDGQEVGLVLG
ncbi:putative Ubiquitin-like domain-containing protein [Helianthus annuus]|uniref:Putative ubiquitin n=1 Tax=Helianthus annuus TaxID=4232 RepID=A0A251VS55_HELAN|nr:putative Ubiquitin domain-containing protein [Helianthus annuus]KAJ0628176.1 putative Ubiquitin-like domain-containing protein [Helianthus annuus]KAJ0784464.1 putative Ubiquitin-like domain-containing protein [Helianthus annuus]KAJ0949515.1 putative Ubiquitin-like domain-containing protein [Helianthus annuus]